MRTRMASQDELSESWSPEEESPKASYLRRKSEEGRKFRHEDVVKPEDPSP